MVSFMTQEPEVSIPADVKTLMLTFKIPPLEAKFLQALLAQDWVGKDELPVIRYSARQLVYKLRAKLDPMGVFIVNDSATRYALPPSSKVMAKLLIEKALAAPTPRVRAV